MKLIIVFFIFILNIQAGNLERELSRMIGWTIVGNVEIIGTIDEGKEDSMFRGCNGKNIIVFSNNLKALCISYELALEIRPTAIIFNKNTTIDNREVKMYKMLVKDTIYNINPR
ncbi:hypothetical protein [Arcobacter sp. s6]|uniref:hypothetical protein n=1 Tax=Arcobacter sp. s6 TaxID=3230363 RepID=UPI0034A075EB